ncbi:hypothetical protein E2K80_10755 [Rhodophyticola sp. CCM32]|uniref:hypothetical protein n=1 Tax=Rhodophyticola sp. CCM32 TaxID=2916397 RepID=UPI00107F7D02|nr:hypothetical protein [Rhodophyticola sp. CCM32]QBY01144.1 hypothetical protein E2K80_10755 [Rhodophyticola sp. CCM32]
MTLAAALVLLTKIWLWVGAAVALAFLTIGMGRIDEDARGAYVFRPLIAPGVIMIWPLVLWRWWVLETGRDDWTRRHHPPRRFHARAWCVMAIIIPLIFIASLAARQSLTELTAPVLLEPPQEAGQ